MKNRKWTTYSLAFMAFAFTTATAEAPSITFHFAKFNVSGAEQTALGGVNNAGVIAGVYTDKNQHTHCFTKNGTTVTTIDAPKGTDDQCGSINNHGAVVGTYTNANTGYDVGFLYQNGKFTDIADPAGTFGTEAHAINDNGDIVGSYKTTNGVHGFLLRKGRYKTLSVPTSPTYTVATGINNKGDIVLIYLNLKSGGLASDFYNLRKYKDVSPPGSMESAPTGINNEGDISFDSFAVVHGSQQTTGSLLHGGTYYPFSYPKVAETYGGGLNDKGMMAGSYQVKNINGPYSGYIATYR
jgi:probable HAF family extracellular repeat protein